MTTISNDLGDAFEKFKKGILVFHRGFRAIREPEGLLYNNKYYPTIEDFKNAVDRYIEQGGVIIGNSIKSYKDGR